MNASVVFHYVRQRRAGQQLNPVSYVVLPVIGAVIYAYLLSQLDAWHVGVPPRRWRWAYVGVVQQVITGLCDAGDEVVFAWRSFDAYPVLVEPAGARPVRVPLDDAEGQYFDAITAAVTERTNGPNCKKDPTKALSAVRQAGHLSTRIR